MKWMLVERNKYETLSDELTLEKALCNTYKAEANVYRRITDSLTKENTSLKARLHTALEELAKLRGDAEEKSEEETKQ